MTDEGKVLRLLKEYIINAEEGCTGCAYVDREEWEDPCKMCKRNCKDYWRRGEGAKDLLEI